MKQKHGFLQELRRYAVFSNPSGGNRPWRIRIRRREHEAKSSTPQSKAVQCQVKQYKAKRNKPNPISSYLEEPDSRVESHRGTQISSPNPRKQAILLQKKVRTPRATPNWGKNILSLDDLDVEFGFSRVDFPPKGSKTQRIGVIHARTLCMNL